MFKLLLKYLKRLKFFTTLLIMFEFPTGKRFCSGI